MVVGSFLCGGPGPAHHLCGISSTLQLDRHLQFDVPQEDSAQVLACLAGDPSHHLTGGADHHPLSPAEHMSNVSSCTAQR